MSKRSATIWRNKIQDYESTNPSTEVFIDEDGQDPWRGPIYIVTVLPGDGYQYHLYKAEDCRRWLHDAY